MIVSVGDAVDPGAMCALHVERTHPVVGSYRDETGRSVDVCAHCLAKAEEAMARQADVQRAIADGAAITRDQADQLATRLTEAGEAWVTEAAAMDLIAWTSPADAEHHDLAALSVDVVDRELRYESLLYRRGPGQPWYATGWSNASRARIYRHGLPEERTPIDDRAQ